MKPLSKLSALLLAALLAVCCLGGALAEDGAELIVTGTASVQVAADGAQIILGVTTGASAVDAASAANITAVDAVIEALKAAGVAAEDIVTENYSVSAIYGYSYGKLDGTDRPSGYNVSNELHVTVRDIDAVGAVIDAGLNAGANECYGITFTSSQAAAAYDRALEQAIAEAARKAGLMANACGRTLGELTAVEEGGGSGIAVLAKSSLEEAAADTTVIADGLTYTANVTLTYALR